MMSQAQWRVFGRAGRRTGQLAVTRPDGRWAIGGQPGVIGGQPGVIGGYPG